MNNLPDEDLQLTNFLRQHRSIAPPPHSNLEDLLMAEINFPPVETKQHSYSLRRYLTSAILLIVTRVVGGSIYHVLNPPDLNVAELQQLNLYLEAHTDSLVLSSDSDVESHDLSNLDLLINIEPEDS